MVSVGATPTYREMGIWANTLPFPSAYSIEYGAPLPSPDDSKVAPSPITPNSDHVRSKNHSARTARVKSQREKGRRPREGQKGKKRQRQKTLEYEFKIVMMDLDSDGSVVRAETVYRKEANSTPGVQKNLYLETSSHDRESSSLVSKFSHTPRGRLSFHTFEIV